MAIRIKSFKDIKFVLCKGIVSNLEINIAMRYILYYRARYQKINVWD